MMARRTPLKRTAFKRVRAEGPTERASRDERPMAKVTPGTRRGVIAPSSAKVVAIPKQPRQRNQHLLDMARGKPCLFWFVADCSGVDGSTTVHAHDNRLSANKGKGLKAHDWRGLQACYACHVAYDQGSAHTYEQKNAAFDEAYELRQIPAWRVIAASATAKKNDRDAARWAVNHNEVHQLKGDQ